MNTVGEYDKLNTIFLKKNQFNTLVIGSSRAESHFNPAIIDPVTGLNTFNAGLEGATMPFILASLEAYLLKSEAPVNVILNLDLHAFKGNTDTIHRFPRYFPYLSNEILYQRLKLRDSRFGYFKFIPFYSMPFFNDRYLDASFRGFSGMPNEFDRTLIRGYAPVPEKLQQDVDTVNYTLFRSEPRLLVIESFKAIALICKEKNCKLIVVVSPMYDKARSALLNHDNLLEAFKRISESNNAVFIDYSKSEMTNNKLYFADPHHLNKKGSEVFSLQFASDLLQYLRH